MNSEISCPICGRENIPFESASCPQCDADLTCFKALDSFDEGPLQEKPQPGKKNIFFIAGAVLLLLSTFGFGLLQTYRLNRLESGISDLHTVVTCVIDKLDGKLERLLKNQSSLHKALIPKTEQTSNKIEDAISATHTGKEASKKTGDAKEEIREITEESATEQMELSKLKAVNGPKREIVEKFSSNKMEWWTHDADENDTLWSIARKYYGKGEYYPVLLEHNSQLGIYSIGDGVAIKILKNAKPVKKIYEKITLREGRDLYWLYTILEGDTPGSLAKRFYKGENFSNRITGLNPGVQFRPGARIKILLE